MTKQLACSCPIGWLQPQHRMKKLDEDNSINIIIAYDTIPPEDEL